MPRIDAPIVIPVATNIAGGNTADATISPSLIVFNTTSFSKGSIPEAFKRPIPIAKTRFAEVIGFSDRSPPGPIGPAPICDLSTKSPVMLFMSWLYPSSQ